MIRAGRIFLPLMSCCGVGMAKRKISEGDSAFPRNLAGFGYGFNDAGQLRKIDEGGGGFTSQGFQFEVKPGDRGYNQRHYEALGEVVTDEVYNLLETRGRLKRVPVGGSSSKFRSFVFVSEGFENQDKLLVLIHGSGVVRAGQWTRKLIINEDLDKGTMLPFISHALDSSWGVVVMNTNLNTDPNTGRSIKGSEDPEAHGETVWREMVEPSKASKIAVIAHSYGGVVAVRLAKTFKEDFLSRVERVLLTDSVHGRLTGVREVDEKLVKVGTNYVASELELGSKAEQAYYGREGIERVSAGDGRHEWTSWSAMGEIFKDMDKVGTFPKEEMENSAMKATEAVSKDVRSEFEKEEVNDMELEVKKPEESPGWKSDKVTVETGGRVDGGDNDERKEL